MRSVQVFLVFAVCVIQVLSQNYYQNQRQNQNAYNRQNQNQNAYQSQYQNQNGYESQNAYQSQRNTNVRSSGSCAEKDGFYPTSSCDGYIQCKDGVPEEKLCPDGLLFNPATGPQAYPCQYPNEVDCAGRTSTQPAQATDECPHQFGYYKMGDAQNCGKFMNCAAGRGFIFDCPEGLAFNEETYKCDWPDQVKSCDAEAYLGFTCPQAAKSPFGQEEYRTFRSPNDCQRYFVCVDHRPRLQNCGEGRAFNDITNECDGIENVTSCAGPSQYQRGVQPTQLSYNDNNNNNYNQRNINNNYNQRTNYRG